MNRYRLGILALLPGLVVFLAYFPIIGGDFLNWDDSRILVENNHLQTLDFSSIIWAFTSFDYDDWMPLTRFSFILNFWMGGADPRIYHLTNLFFHGLNTVLVFFITYKIMRLIENQGVLTNEKRSRISPVPTAFLAALLFGLHPIHVESVAWISERKDVLYSFFYLASLLVYLGYASSKARKGFQLFICWVLFLFACLSKSMAVTLPLVFLILDGCPLKRIPLEGRKVLTEKIPFFCLSLFTGYLAIFSHSEAIPASETILLPWRVLNACRAVFFYIGKMLVPANLSPFYPFPKVIGGPYGWECFIALLLFLGVSAGCFYYRIRKPYLMVAWLCYLVTLAPVLGLYQVVQHTMVADRYTYLASLAVFIPFSAIWVGWLWVKKRLFISLCAFLALFLGIETWNQAKIWRSSITLWETVLRIYPDAPAMVHGNLGAAYEEAGRFNDASFEYDRVAALSPEWAVPHNRKGSVLLRLGKLDEAIAEFKIAVALDSDYALPHQNLWRAYERKSMSQKALAEIRKAGEIDPQTADELNQQGMSDGREGLYDDSEIDFRGSLVLEPANQRYLLNLAATEVFAKRLDKAILIYQGAAKTYPSEPVYFMDMGDIYLMEGKPAKAIHAYQAAEQIQPGNPVIEEKLAKARNGYSLAVSSGSPAHP